MTRTDDASTASTASARPTRGRAAPDRRRWWLALVAVGWILVLGGALLRAGGERQADAIEEVPLGLTVLQPLEAGDVASQDIRAKADGLSVVNVRFGTYERTPDCELRIELVQRGGDRVADQRRDCADLPDATLTPAVEVDPIEDSEGRWYTLRVEVVGGELPITLFATPARPDAPAAEPAAISPDGDAVEVHTEYGRDDRAVAQLGVLLDRLAEYGPFWNGPVGVVVLVLGLVALTFGLVLAPWRVALVLVVAFAVVKGVLWSVALPPMLGVDEQAHIAYAQFMAAEGGIPKRSHPANDGPIYSVELEAAAQVFRQPYVARSDRADYGDAAEHLALDEVEGDRTSNGDGAAAGYSPAYYAVPALLEGLTPGSIDVRIGVMRLWSVALGAATVLAAALMGRRLFPDGTAPAVLLGLAVALHPMLSQQTAIVNNDALLIAGGAWALLASVALATPGRARWWPLVGGLALGAGLLAKPLAWAFLPVLLAAWVVGRLREQPAATWRSDALGLGGGLVATYGLWWATSIAFGYPGTGFQDERPGGGLGLRAFLDQLTADWLAVPRRNWIDQYWGNFGWINIPFPPAVQAVATVAVGLGVALGAGWLVLVGLDLWRAWRSGDPGPRSPRWTPTVQTAVCLLAGLASLGVVHVLMFDYFRRTGDLDFVQGRYVLMITPALLVLPALFLRRIWPRLSPTVPMAVVAVGMGVLNVIGLGLVLERFYL